MIILILGILFSTLSFSQNINQEMWYLNPIGQEIKIDLSDINTEIIKANPMLNYGFNELKNYSLKKIVKVAIIDSGIDKSHDLIKDHLAYKTSECEQGTIIGPMEQDHDQNTYKNDCLGWNFTSKDNRIDDEDGHGTHVAGIMQTFFRSHLPYFKILPLKIFTEEQEDSPLPMKVYEAFDYAINEKVDLIHLSMGWPESLMSIKIEQIIQKALDQDIIVVAAAGNSAQRADIYPCKLEGVICVGALRPNGELAPFSNFGPQVDFLAPGEKILSPIPYFIDPLYLPIRGYDFKNGTSQAAPFISGAALFLKALNPELNRKEIYTKLLRSALDSKKTLKSMINIPRAIKENTDFIIPKIKHLNTLTVEESNRIKLSFENISKNKNITASIVFSCFESIIKKEIDFRPLQNINLDIELNVKKHQDQNCSLVINNINYSIHFKVLAKPKYKSEYLITEPNIVRPVIGKVLSSFRSIPSIPGHNPKALYYLKDETQGLVLFNKNKKLGILNDKENCKRLRLWQHDLNNDKKQDFLIEYLCSESSLLYSFVDQELNPIFSDLSFTPNYSIINYRSFKLLTYDYKHPEFLYLNHGFNKGSQNTTSNQRRANLYKLVKRESEYTEVFINDEEKWKQELNYRFKPDINILSLISDKEYLVEIEGVKYFASIADNSLLKANLDHVLISTQEVSPIYNSHDLIFNSLITPYDYSGIFLNGSTMNYRHLDIMDPIMQVLAVVKNDLGHKVYLKTYSNLLVIQFDYIGNVVSSKKSPISRFDFLNGDELQATIYPVFSNGIFKVVVDGTRIHTNYIDIVQNTVNSIDLSTNCASQKPIFLDKNAFLPVVCYENNKQIFKLIEI